MKYFLFLDESGDHGLTKFDHDFPVFLLCGVLVRDDELNKIVVNSRYSIIASVIQKEAFIQKFGKLHDDIYEIALSFVLEQAILVLQKVNPQSQLSIIIEKRGKKEDKQLEVHFQKIIAVGTGMLTGGQVNQFDLSFTFKNKKENINGLQLADLVAYPIARKMIEPNRANPAFEILEEKIYKTKGRIEGLRIYP